MKQRTQIRLNLVLSLTLAQVAFLAGIDASENLVSFDTSNELGDRHFIRLTLSTPQENLTQPEDFQILICRQTKTKGSFTCATQA